MAVITISRGTMSGGKLIAERVAEQCGFRCVDRDVIVEKAAASGVSHEELRAALEKPPTFLDRFKHKKYLYLALIQAALTEEVKMGKTVYHGNAGHLLLQGAGPVFRVRIIAPMEFRIKMAQKRLKFSEKEAVAYIEKMDASRIKWTQYLYGVDWSNPSLYDLVINLEHMDMTQAADAVAYLVRRQACFEFSSKCQAAMNDLALASRVKADLALNKATGYLEFEVVSQDGRVTIAGKLPDIKLAEEVKRVASAAPGVLEVDVSPLTTQVPA